MRENAASKARRYLVEGRVVVTVVRTGGVMARVRGDGRVWDAGYLQGRWYCNCWARTDQCAHLRALRLITAPDLTESTIVDHRTIGERGDASRFEGR